MWRKQECQSARNFFEDECELYIAEQKWMPVTERPPKPDAYLVTYHDYVSDDGIREVDVLEYVEYRDREMKNVEYGWWGYEKVVDAWMQLPEPYRPEEG